MSALLHPRFWAAHALMVAAVVAAVLLGLWQLHVWQAARDAAAVDLSHLPVEPLAEVMGGDDPFPGRDLGRPVRFSGEWMPSATLYVADRTLHGRRGYWVVTPVRIGASAMPVVRGWSPRTTAPAVSGPTTITGWLQPSEGTSAPDNDPRDDVLPEMRIASIVEHVDTDLYSAFVVQRDPRAAGLAPVPPRAIPSVSNLTSLRNLLYAVQWWIFGGFAIYVWQRWLRDQLTREDEEDSEEDTEQDPEEDPDPAQDPGQNPGPAREEQPAGT